MFLARCYSLYVVISGAVGTSCLCDIHHGVGDVTPDGLEKVNFKTEDGTKAENINFSDKFWEIWEKEGYTFPGNTKLNYLFCYVSKKMRRVVLYEKEDLIFVGCSCPQQFDLYLPISTITANTNWKSPRNFGYLKGKTREEILHIVNTFNPFQIQRGRGARDGYTFSHSNQDGCGYCQLKKQENSIYL
eukprot:TRINITY_DN7656_c0_g1_i12.p1 TRINITY_DN7656_c0_g1~~TRINITY_DN7656_c0_g1_i12.p1  ORF type:complete len:188 (+),score=46.13 TRINITY_DN7656_c0_g1_i12:772-1335(+)